MHSVANMNANEISQQLSIKIQHLEYLLEGQTSYGLSRVKNMPQAHWQPALQSPLNLGNLKQGAWGRFRLVNVEDVQLERILEFANPSLYRLSIYTESSLGNKNEWSLGSYLPYKEREISFRNFAIPLSLQAQEELVVYFRAQSNVGLLLPISIHKEVEFWRLANEENLAYGLYFGILIMFVMFNISLYLTRNNYLFMLLALDLCVFSLMYANHLGLSFEYFWPVDPQFNYLASVFLGYVVILISNVFTWHFLQLKDSKRLHRVYYFINTIVIVAIALLWLLPAVISSLLCAISGILLGFYLAWLTTKNRYRSGDYSYYYIFSYSVMAMAVCIYITHKLALLPTNFLTSSVLAASILLQAIVLTSVVIERKKTPKRMVGFQSSEQPDSAKDWVAQFSHEVRTPLNGIIGMVELLRETPLNPTQYGYIRTLSSSGEYLLNLVNDELDYNNLSRGGLILNETAFNLELLCHQCCKMLEQQSSNGQINIEVDFLSLKQFDFYGDEKCLKQIIINLLSNSIRFAHQGRIVIKAEYSESNYLVLSVWDNGVGITKQQQLGIFERFRQVDSGAYSRAEGSGLGLAVCQQLTQLMGGSIAVDSRVGEYCRFTVSVPLAIYSKPIETKPIETKASTVSGRSSRESSSPFSSTVSPILASKELVVLGVDDNEINRRVLSAMLKKLGHRVIEATNGQQAIDIVRSGESLDLILMDCEMPRMSGFEATEIIRRWQYGQTKAVCPIIALTAHTFEEHIEQCLASGMDAHLSKPLHLDKLRELLESLAAGGRKEHLD